MGGCGSSSGGYGVAWSRWLVTGTSGGGSSLAAPMADGGRQELQRAHARENRGGL
jgi:hypothetical protein